MLLFVILIGGCRVVRKNRTNSQLFSSSMNVDTSQVQTIDIETTRGDSSILIQGGFMMSSFEFSPLDTLVSDSVVTADGKVVVQITPGKNGKKAIKYRATTASKTITPTYTQTKVSYSNDQTGTTTIETSKANITTQNREVKNQFNGYILAALLIGLFIFIFISFYNYFKK